MLLSMVPLALAAEYFVYVGTYTNTGKSQGIYAYRFDSNTGKLTDARGPRARMTAATATNQRTTSATQRADAPNPLSAVTDELANTKHSTVSATEAPNTRATDSLSPQTSIDGRYSA